MIRRQKRASLWLGVAALPTFIAGGAADSAVLLVLSAALYTGSIVAYLLAKGRSVAWAFLGIYPLFGWLIVAGLSDHSYSDKGSETWKRRLRRQEHRKLRTFTSLIYPLSSLLWVLGALNQWMDVVSDPSPLVVSLMLLRAGCLCGLGYAIHRGHRGGAIAAAVVFLLASACESMAQGNASEVIMLPVFALFLSLGVLATFTEPSETHHEEPVAEPVSPAPSTLVRRGLLYAAIVAVVSCGGLGIGMLTLSGIAVLSTALALAAQDLVLARDLEQAAIQRLEAAAGSTERLADVHLAAIAGRYRAISGTPQFRANLEVQHAPTLRFYAQNLQQREGAALLVFLDSSGATRVTAGDESLAPQRTPAPGASLVAHGGVPYAEVVIPIGDASTPVGWLVFQSMATSRSTGTSWQGRIRRSTSPSTRATCCYRSRIGFCCGG